MRCTTCDADVLANAAFCVRCGTRLPSVASAPKKTLQSAPSAAAPSFVAQGAESYGIQPYTPHSYPTSIAAPQTSTIALMSLIFGILAWVVLPIIGGIIAVIAGHLAQREIQTSDRHIQGSKIALAGLILGYLHLLLPLILYFFAAPFLFPPMW